MLEECKNFNCNYLKKFSNNTLVLSGIKDVILKTDYNDTFCKNNNINNIYLNASHSLFENINQAFTYTIAFLTDKEFSSNINQIIKSK